MMSPDTPYIHTVSFLIMGNKAGAEGAVLFTSGVGCAKLLSFVLHHHPPTVLSYKT